MSLFGKRKAAAENVDSLDLVEKKVMASLHEGVLSVDSQSGLDALEQKLAVLERLRSLRSHCNEEKQEKPLLQTAAGASLITGGLMLLAAMPSTWVAFYGKHAELRNMMLKPIAETVAADTTLDLDMKLALLDAIVGRRISKRHTVAEFKANFLRDREIMRLDDLRERGLIADEEYVERKKVLAGD